MMTRKIILRLLLFLAFSVTLYSCVHDEINSSANPSNSEYTSKSLWKEDEVYIKNVMKVYQEHETEIKKVSGTPFWDYATTMDKFDESFLMVPIVESGKVVSVLQVPRHADKVYFIYTKSDEDLLFFTNLLSTKVKKTMKTEMSSELSKLVCTTRAFSVWHPDSEANPYPENGSGHWQTYHVTTCKFAQIEQCIGVVGPDGECSGGGGGDGGFPYPGGGGGNNPEPPELDPCQKTKTTMQNPQVKTKLQQLQAQSALGGEKAFMIKADGTTSPMIQGEEHSTQLGNVNGYQGYYHNHTPDGIKMLSVRDIYKLFEFIKFQPPGAPIGEVFAGMVGTMPLPGGGVEYFNYIVQFNGDADEADNIYSTGYNFDVLRNNYQDFERELRNKPGYSAPNGNFLSFKGLEEVFFDSLANMGIDKDKMILQRIDKNGNVMNITMGTDGKPTSTPCP
ncbi:hypothetical protein [Chryseobacterium sp. JUb7]|uniref:hypothetical protein n=1 Tax=Chryseobacterium sp. JUb7 TaxID=2940599 RepID=UPI00216AA331|nr:hypothetical protein [Chryseobacterium sp. JUb7]MCS3529155.1 hypothetical protein [Chryseobacterium sp. JUb7]